jgi:hypothetical protein
MPDTAGAIAGAHVCLRVTHRESAIGFARNLGFDPAPSCAWSLPAKSLTGQAERLISTG